MTVGRKPKPTVLHLVQGTTKARHKRAAKHEPKPKGNLREPPEWLTETQRLGWIYALAHAPAGLLKRLDRGVLTAWVVAEDLHRTAVIAQAKIDASNDLPLLVRTSATANANDQQKLGTFQQSPYLAVINRQAQIMIKAASELGFSPASRPRIATDITPPDNDHEDNNPFSRVGA